MYEGRHSYSMQYVTTMFLVVPCMLCFIYCLDPFSFCFYFCFFLFPHFLQQDPKKAENFDKMFTRSAFKLTPTDAFVVMNIDESAFYNFSYANPYYKPLPSSLSQSPSPSTHHL